MRYFTATIEMLFIWALMLIVGTGARLFAIMRISASDPLMMLALIAWMWSRV